MWYFINGILVVLFLNYSCFFINIYDVINIVIFIRLIELKNILCIFFIRYNWVLL